MVGDTRSGHVGVPVPCCALKLVDVPELNYFARDNAGEICIRGPNVTRGYYMNPEATAEAIDSDGWLHTGDIGVWEEAGTLRVVDRKKNIFKLAQVSIGTVGWCVFRWLLKLNDIRSKVQT